MSDFTPALTTRLLADAGLTLAIGTKIHWDVVPAGTALPYVRLQVVSDPDATDLKGAPGGRDVRLQADCFAETFLASRELAVLLKAALRMPALVEGVQFGRALFDGPRGGGEDGPTSWVHRASMDCALWVSPT